MFFGDNDRVIGQAWHRYEGDQQANLVVTKDANGCEYILMNIVQRYDGGNHPTEKVCVPALRNDVPVFTDTVYQVTGVDELPKYAFGKTTNEITENLFPRIKEMIRLAKL